MSNDYYNHTSGQPAANSRGTSAAIRTELELIKTGFGLIPALKALFGNRANYSTVTGPADAYVVALNAALTTYDDGMEVVAKIVLTNATTTPTLRINALAAKTITRSNGDAMAPGDLIGITSFRFNITTDCWEYRNTGAQGAQGIQGTPGLNALGTGGATLTGSVTLTSSSAAAQVVTPATPGLYATLPNATTCSKGVPLFDIFNAGEFDYGIKNSAGTQLGWIRAGTSGVITLGDNSTAAGAWGCTNLEKVGVTAEYTHPTYATSGTTMIVIELDSDRTAFIFGGNVSVLVYNKTTQVWGTPTLIRSSGLFFQAVKSATDQLLVVSCDGATALEAVTVNFSNVTPTVNTANKHTATLAGSIANMSFMLAVGSSFVVSYGRATNVGGIRAISLSGNTPTIGSESAMTGSGAISPKIYATGSIVMTMHVASTTFYAKPFTVSGSSLSAGTEATSTISSAQFKSSVLPNGRWIVFFINSTQYAAIVKLTTTVAAISATSMGTTTGAPQRIQLAFIGQDKVVCFYHAASTNWYANTVIDTAGTVGVGTEISGVTGANINTNTWVATSGNNISFVLNYSSGHTVYNFDGSGASPVLSTQYAMPGPSGTAIFQSPDDSNVRNFRSAYVGNSLTSTHATTSQIFNVRANSSGIRKLSGVNFRVKDASAGVPGNSDNECWYNDVFSTGVGLLINRVEVAA